MFVGRNISTGWHVEFARFVQSLAFEGRVVVPAPGEVTEKERQEAVAALRSVDAQTRLEMPHQPPSLDEPAALWGALQFFRACQFATFRDVDAEVVQAALSESCPDHNRPAAHYAVDLTFRFLPNLLHFAKSASESDVLTACLHNYCREWPLSSVGVAGIKPDNVNILCEDASLLALYVDRILATDDVSRLNEAPDGTVSDSKVSGRDGASEAVEQAVRAALGLHHDLAPAKIAALLQASDTPQSTNTNASEPTE